MNMWEAHLRSLSLQMMVGMWGNAMLVTTCKCIPNWPTFHAHMCVCVCVCLKKSKWRVGLVKCGCVTEPETDRKRQTIGKVLKKREWEWRQVIMEMSRGSGISHHEKEFPFDFILHLPQGLFCLFLTFFLFIFSLLISSRSSHFLSSLSSSSSLTHLFSPKAFTAFALAAVDHHTPEFCVDAQPRLPRVFAWAEPFTAILFCFFLSRTRDL